MEERHVPEENEHPTSFGNRQGSDTNLRPLDTENNDEVTEGGGDDVPMDLDDNELGNFGQEEDDVVDSNMVVSVEPNKHRAIA